MKQLTYKHTFFACLLGNFVQAIVINMIAVVFVPIMRLYNLSYGSLGTLVFINFLTQVASDIILSKLPDKYGFKPFALIGTSFIVIGFVLFAMAPVLFPHRIFLGFIVGTVVFSAAGGILELLLTPLTMSLPIEKKSLGILHSFYAWGLVGTILISTILIYFFPTNLWFVTPLFWAIFPLVCFLLFIKCPMPKSVSKGEHSKMGKMLLNPIYLLCLAGIFAGGASETIISQWSSTFVQNGLGLNKFTGDIVGPCMFAVALGIVRVIQGINEDKFNLNTLLVISSAVTIVGFLGVTLTSSNTIAIASIILCGFSTSMLWPGTLSVAGKTFPTAGAWIYALMAAAGDIGAASAPFITGFVVDLLNTPVYVSTALGYGLSVEQFALKAGILVGIIFPILTLIIHLTLKHKTKKIAAFLK